jgi:hypothetical protein
MEVKYTEITENEAKTMYIHSEKVFVSTDMRKFWKLPASYEYASHEPKKELFYRSIPECEGKVTFFKVAEAPKKYLYKIGVGVQGIPLEFHKVEANSMTEARSIAIRRFLHPDKGFDHIEVKRIKREK